MKVGTTDTKASPYRGARSYDARDGRLFYGRDEEASRLASLTLGTSFTLLHAPSGAGKSSLIGARLMSDIEARGNWVAVRAYPRFSPLDEIKAATLSRVFPPAEAEAAAIENVLAAYRSPNAVAHCPPDLRIDEFTPLADVKRRYAALTELASHPQSPEQARALQAILHDALKPVTTEDIFAGLQGTLEITPVFQRFVFTQNGERLLAAHLASLISWSGRIAGSSLPDLFKLGADGPHHGLMDRLGSVMLGALREFFEFAEVRVAGRAFRDSCFSPDEPLVPFFERLGGGWTPSVSGGDSSTLRILLILDQFEELFTRFRKDEMLAQRKRYFHELQELYVAADPHRSHARTGPKVAPAHVLISMRSDHIAELDGVPEISRHLDQRFRLGFIKLSDVPSVIARPAEDFGYRYSPECREQIIAELQPVSRGEDEVEPQHLQIVCERLWGKFGSLATRDAPIEVTRNDLINLGGAQGVFSEHVRSALHDIHEDDEFTRFELLSILEPLITLGGRRNLVGEEELVSAPFRNPEIRLQMLQALARAGLVRLQPRLGEKNNFAEITHEILIQPINDEIAAGVRSNAKLRALHDALAKAEALQLRAGEYDESPFSDTQLKSLTDVWSRLRMPPAVVEAAYRSAVVSGSTGEALAQWASRVDALPVQVLASDLVMDASRRAASGAYFSGLELDALRRQAVPANEALPFAIESAIRSGNSHQWLWTCVQELMA